MKEILRVEDVSVRYSGFTLFPVNLTVHEGEAVAVLGESGGGKTTLARAIARLLPDTASDSGRILLDGRDLCAMREKDLRALRMEEFAVCFQNSAEWLNPSMTAFAQLSEVLIRRYPRKEHRRIAIELLERVGMGEADLDRLPRQMSGGMIQRFMFAVATALRPALVILDEPTSSLDRAARDELIELIRCLREESQTAFLIITHDVLLAKALCQRTVVLYRGLVVEEAATADLLHAAHHPYTKGLLDAIPALHPYRDMWGIRPPDVPMPQGENCCPFYDRCTQRIDACAQSRPMLREWTPGRPVACHRGGILQLLSAEGIVKRYGDQQVLAGVNLRVYAGETVAVVGRSGVGKTTLCSILAGFLSRDGGEIRYQGEPADYRKHHKSRYGIQMVFQDSDQAINPRMTVRAAVEEAMMLSGIFPAEQRDARVLEALASVGLPTDEAFVGRAVASLSGGQRQRINLARALTMDPSLLIADEPTSMLDASSKANVLHMLKALQNAKGLSLLIITHDLDSARKIADRIYFIQDGLAHRVPSDSLEELF